MSIVQPLGTDTLASDNHALMHRVFAIDSAAPIKSVVAGSDGKIFMNPYRITSAVVTNTASTLTLTGAQMAAKSIFQQTGTTAPTFTLDTGTALSTAIPGVAVGDVVSFVVSNASNQTITMAGATGTTLANAMTVLTLQNRTFYAINTGSNTWTIY